MSLTPLTLKFVPLVDAAPLMLAQALGFAREEGLDPALIVAPSDPLRNATRDLADLHLAIAPGSDAALLNAVLVAIADRGPPQPPMLRQGRRRRPR